jgi:hypothetical protein
MGRKRIELDADRIVALMARGRTGEEIAAELSTRARTVSVATVVRRMRELKVRAHEARATRAKSRRASAGRAAVEASAPPIPVESTPEAMPEDVPAGLPVEAYDEMIERAKRNMQAAENDDEHTAAQGWARVALVAMTERRKATPPPKTDPNEMPDMIAAAKRAREALHKLIVTSPEEAMGVA